MQLESSLNPIQFPGSGTGSDARAATESGAAEVAATAAVVKGSPPLSGVWPVLGSILMLPGRRVGAWIAVSFWLLICRFVCGVGCLVDGVYKLGLLPWDPPSRDNFQPSPLGPVSDVIELVAGLLVFIGFRCRTGVLVLGGHLAVGNLVLRLRDPSAFPSKEWDQVYFLAVVLVLGPGWFSVDYFWPDAHTRLLRRQSQPPVLKRDPGFQSIYLATVIIVLALIIAFVAFMAIRT